MARTLAALPPGARISDYISLGVLTGRIPMDRVKQVLRELDLQSRRERKLPAHVVVYYVIALALYMQVSYGEVLRCLCEGLEWLGLKGVKRIRQTGRSGISQARKRLGSRPLKRLYEELAVPIAEPATRGAFYRKWRLVSLDGSVLDIADTSANARSFGRPKAWRGRSAFPQIRFVSLLEIGTHVLFGAQVGGYRRGELSLAAGLLKRLKTGMLCLADRGFYGYELWTKACAGRADLLWRVRKSQVLKCLERLPDGSYLSKVHPSVYARKTDREGRLVRVIEYRLRGTSNPKRVYRLITTILDPRQAPAPELASLYHERWEIENALDELKTHLRGRRIVLRSKTPELVRQEFYGLLLAHFAIRGLMHEAALQEDVDPDSLSFVHSVRVIRRKMPRAASIPP